MSDPLSKHRARIDALDEEILKLINERAAHARSIGEIKNGEVYRAEREAQILRRVREKNPGPLPAEAMAALFREIMSACLALEKPLAVSYLGPPGTFSQAAALKHFGQSAGAVACGSIAEVVRKVEAEAVNYGIVPVENSGEGAVGQTLDLMLQTPLKVCGEVMLRVHQQLLSRTGNVNEIARVYSHSQSLAQCEAWLNSNLPRAERVAVGSNAEAAKLAAKEENAAAIAGETAAQLYQLQVVAQNIEDDANNTTRFWVIGTCDCAPSGKDKTSLVMSAKNRPGAVHELLTPLARHQVSMTKLESRPSKTGLWEYVFFVDIEGHQQEKNVALALAELDELAMFLKILGSYPVAVL
ncbi:MAG: prephenate dehydratase [Burkholderiales bacterium]